ncbi:MAG: hypothetical protein ACI9QN_001755, partial [Arcticibacterium sp.]
WTWSSLINKKRWSLAKKNYIDIVAKSLFLNLG